MDSESRTKGLKACSACASAKVRCDVLAGQRRCKRCERLDKDCNAQPRGSHRQKSVARTYGREDILRLESKFDSVAQLLSASSSLPTIKVPATDGSLGDTASPTPGLVATPPLVSLFTEPLSPEINLAAYQMFELYREEMMPLFPFVIIPLYQTPETLLRERPMLYMAIMVVSFQRDVDVQQHLAQRWREELGRRIWVQGEKSVQLLQGILVYLAWHQTHLQLGSQLGNLLHTAMSLVTELEIDKEPLSKSHVSPGALGDFSSDQTTQPGRTLEERRCHLGVFWLNSVLRICVKDMIPMPSTPFIEESCQILEQRPQYPSDMYLVRLVRTQLVADKIDTTLYRDLNRATITASATVVMAVSHLEKEIQSLEATQREDIPQQALLMISYYMLQVFLYKVGLDERLHQPSASASATTSLHALRCSHLLVSCVGAIKALIGSFLSLRNITILSIPHPNWIQMGHSILVFSRLLVTNHSFWDPSILTDVADFAATLERISNKIEGAMTEGMAASPPRLLPSIFTTLRERLVDICSKVEESSRLNTNAKAGEDQTAAMLDAGNTMMNVETEALFFSFLNDGGFM